MRNYLKKENIDLSQKPWIKFIGFILVVLTFSVIIFGLLLVSSICATNIFKEIYNANVKNVLSIIFLIAQGLLGSASFYGYIKVTAALLDSAKQDIRKLLAKKYLLKNANLSSKKNILKIIYVSLTLIFTVVLGIVSITGFIRNIPTLSSEISLMSLLWMSLTLVSVSAPYVAWLASNISHDPLKTYSRTSQFTQNTIRLLPQRKFKKMLEYETATRGSGFLDRYEQVKKYSEQLPKKPSVKQNVETLSEEIDQNLSVLRQGNAFEHEINKANDLIPDAQITDDLNIICKYVNDIFAQAAKDKSIEHQIRKFSNIYLPQTMKLCNLYIDLEAKHVQTEEVEMLKEQIAKSIANAEEAFANFHDNIFRQSSINIEAEIESFERILSIDGLLGRREIILPTEKNEKKEA